MTIDTPQSRLPLLTVAEVAEILGVSTAWVTSHAAGRRKPRLPAIGLGQPKGPKLWRFRRVDLERLLEEYKVKI